MLVAKPFYNSCQVSFNKECILNKFKSSGGFCTYGCYMGITLTLLYMIAECQTLVVGLVKDIAQKYPQEFENLKNSLSAEQVTRMNTCFEAVVNGH